MVSCRPEENLKMMECKSCGGQWLSSQNFWKWVGSLDKSVQNEEIKAVEYEIRDSDNAKMCLDCGKIMIKYRVGHGLNYKLDHCNSCGGVWFDKNEWNALKNKNLHRELRSIFTRGWQAKVQSEEKTLLLEKHYKKRFGTDYERIADFKSWMDKHELKASVLAYLSDPRPFE